MIYIAIYTYEVAMLVTLFVLLFCIGLLYLVSWLVDPDDEDHWDDYY